MTATDPVQAVAEALFRWNTGTDPYFVIKGRVHQIERGQQDGPYIPIAEAAIAAARPLIEREAKAAALREAADLVGGSSGPRHGVKMPDEQEWAQWLYDRADRIEREADR